MRSFVQTVGYHYCKLLSPARAMEWIYVDGLKVHPRHGPNVVLKYEQKCAQEESGDLIDTPAPGAFCRSSYSMCTR